MTVRERMQELTKDARTLVDMGRIFKSTFATIHAEFPDANPMEIQYEWENAKAAIKHMAIMRMVDGDEY